MSILNVNKIQPVGSATTVTMEGNYDFLGKQSINSDPAWLDTYGVVRTNRSTLNEDVTIPVGTNGMSIGPLQVGAGISVTVNGSWTIV